MAYNPDSMTRSALFLCVYLSVSVWAFSGIASASCPRLISPDTLNETLKDYVILDARSKKEWQTSHLPGALSLSWEDYTRVDEKGIAYRMLAPEKMAARLGSMGMNEQSAVAIYGDADTSWGGEGWLAWLFDYLGHQGPVMVLDGGIQAWKKRKLPLRSAKNHKPKRPVKTYQPTPDPLIDIETAELSRKIKTIQTVDTRSFFERIRGSIPGSVHITWTKFYTGDTRKPLAADQLKSLLQDHGIDPDKPVVYFCTGGVRSAYAWMVHCLAGLGPARNYEGGTEAWNKEAKRP